MKSQVWIALLLLSGAAQAREMTPTPAAPVAPAPFDPEWFAEAERAYPSVPEGLLEAIAWTGSRWSHRIPERAQDGHHLMPQTWGVMGLHRGIAGRADVVGEAAAALGVPAERVARDGATQVMATAALLERWIEDEGLARPVVEELVPLLMRLSGLPGEGDVADFARRSYAYDVLLAMDRGIDAEGHSLAPQAIQWALAFDPWGLAEQRAPLVNIDVDRDAVVVPGLTIDPAREQLVPTGKTTATTTADYPPALWVTSPNYSSRSGTTITHIVIHTTQGSYSGAISWFQNPDSDVSAHYLIRSSDGQVTQMVREADKAWHVGSENPYTIGIEHEGYVDTSSYYTEAMYNSSAALSKDICKDNNIDCSTCFPGPATSGVSVQSQAYKVKGHQHYPNQTHNDPGQYWNWSKYKTLLSGGVSNPTAVVLDDFESGEGHFNTAPTYSGSTTGISTSSTADRSTAQKKNGSYSEAVTLLDNTTSSAAWQVRFLSGTGDPAQNTKLTKAGGRLGFWIYTTTSGVTAAMSIDDTDGTERSTARTVPTGTWTYLEWKLDDQSEWDAWSGGNGVLDSTTALTVDAVWFYRANSRTKAVIYIDDVGWKQQ